MIAANNLRATRATGENLFTKMGEYSAELMAGALQGNPTSYDTAAKRQRRLAEPAAPAAADAEPGASAGACPRRAPLGGGS